MRSFENIASSIATLAYYAKSHYCTPGELIRSFFLGSWNISIQAPQFFCGTVILVLIIAFFVSSASRKTKLSAGILFFVLIISSWFKWGQFIWCGFRKPNGFYCRSAVFVVFFMLWMAAFGLRQLKKTVPAHVARDTPRYRLRTMLAGIVLVLVVAAELGYGGVLAWRQLYTGYPQDAHEAYVAESIEQLAALQERYNESTNNDGTGSNNAFRFAKTYTRVNMAALNEGMATGAVELATYSSTQNTHAVDFLNALGYSNPGEFSTSYTESILLTDSLLGVRYVSSTTPVAEMISTGITQPSRDATAYENPYALALGYGVSSTLVQFSPDEGLNPFELQNELVSALLGKETACYQPMEATLTTDTEAYLCWRVTVPAGCLGYAYIVSDNTTGLYLSFDDVLLYDNWRFEHSVHALGEVSDQDRNVVVQLSGNSELLESGATSPEQASAVDTLPENTTVLFYCLDMEVFEEAIRELSLQQFNAETFSGNTVTGTYTTDTDGWMLLTVAYDRGWSLTVDGEKAEGQSVCNGALMAVPVHAGENRIELHYTPPGLLGGCIVTVLTVFGLIAAAIIKRIRKRALQKGGPLQDKSL